MTSADGAQAGASSVYSQPKRILFLGGTGFIGPAMVSVARARGHKVTLFNRGKTSPRLFSGVERIIGDRATDLARLRNREWDAVIDTWTRYPSAVGAATELLRDHVGQYLFISTVSVYKLGREPIDESSPLLPITETPPENMELQNYGRLKILCEQLAERNLPGRVTVVRPGVIAGPGDPTDRFTYWPERLARGGRVLVPEAPGYRMQFIDVFDLGAWVISAIEGRHVGVYNAVGPEDPSLHSVIEACKSGVSSDARLEWVDNKWLEERQIGGWEAFPLTVPADAENSGFAHVSAARAIEKGLRFRPVSATALDTLDWWNSQSEERRSRKRPGLTPEREAEILRLWKSR